MMHDIVYYAAMAMLAVYAALMGGALALALADNDDKQAKVILSFAVGLTISVVVLMGVFHG